MRGGAGQQGVFVVQPIVTAGKLGWDRAVVGREIVAAEHEWAMQRLRVANDVRVAAHRLLAESPERRRAVAQIERARAALSRACAGRVPDFELEAGIHYDLASDETLTTVGVAVPLQLFDRNQGNIARAQAELAAAQHEIRRVELTLRDRLAEEFQHYLDARETVAEYRESILPDADAALTLVRKGYTEGELGYLDLLTAQQAYFRTHLAFVDALRDIQISRIRIEGLLLAGGLERPGE